MVIPHLKETRCRDYTSKKSLRLSLFQIFCVSLIRFSIKPMQVPIFTGGIKMGIQIIVPGKSLGKIAPSVFCTFSALTQIYQLMFLVIKTFCHIISTKSNMIYCWVLGTQIPLASSCILTSGPYCITGQ